ncbi:3'-5' exonuclease [Halosquirtibacter laminarini]|uniref:3'-5' exonuclease n=1 Tax=Halosquirtibacter laminarini TaxID=3374600 RepID=A0AC61NBT3_9BACT|nr:3'-5' exonuclease [Prolixibacteraceae bacterium]
MNTFVALDFETATSKRDSACSLAIVTVVDGEIKETYHTFIRPPQNRYDSRNIHVHGITPEMTEFANDFRTAYHQIRKRLVGQVVVAHNESFDRSVLRNTMEYYNLPSEELQLDKQWFCTYKLWKKEGLTPTTLRDCCDHFEIPLNHHDAISDAEAAAKLFMIYQYYLKEIKE